MIYTPDSSSVIHTGNCLDVLKQYPDDHFEAVVCDPPYGLSFMGSGWDHGVPTAEYWGECLRVAKPGAHLVAFGGSRTYHRLTCAIEDAGWQIRDSLMWLYGSGFPKSHNVATAITKASGDTKQAEIWAGWGTALKPAYEPIVLARKPLVGTVAQNVLAYGAGALNLSACRNGDAPRVNQPSGNKAGGVSLNMSRYGMPEDGQPTQAIGRWPTNVLIDDQIAEQLGDKATFFYQAKASRSEREEGLSHLDAQDRAVYGQFVGTEDHSPKVNPRAKNHHPTVKPVAVMAWLVRLVSAPNALILDPFCGSGSTGIAAIRERRRFVGIDLSADYTAIAHARIVHEVSKQVGS